MRRRTEGLRRVLLPEILADPIGTSLTHRFDVHYLHGAMVTPAGLLGHLV